MSTATDPPAVSSGADGRQVLERSTGQVVRSVAFTPDGATVVTADDDGQIGAFDVAGGTASVRLLADLLSRALAVAVTPDGRRVVSGEEHGSVRIGGHRGGPYQAAALLLAVLIAEPDQARALLARLRDAGTTGDVVDLLGQPDDGPTPPGPAALRLAATVTRLRDSGRPVHGDAATYRHWASRVARYSFATYQLHTAGDGPGAGARRT